MMKNGDRSKLRVLLIALIFGSVMVLGQARPALAVGDPITLLLGVTYAGVLAIASIVCIPIAANGDKGFGREYRDCFVPLTPFDEYEDDEDLPEPTPTLVDEQINPNEKSIEIASVATKAEIKAKAEKETGVGVPNGPTEEEDEGWYRDND